MTGAAEQTDSRTPPRRADGVENRRRLIAAADALLQGGSDFTLAEVAAEAGLSTATAYRHFASAEDAVDALVTEFWDEVDSRVAAAGRDLDLAGLSRIWVGTVLERGTAMLYIRSRDGFLARRRAHDPRVMRMVAVAEGPLAAELDRLPARRTAEALSYALSVWNVLADPREILDQRETLRWSAKRIASRLETSVRAAIAAP